MVASHLLIAGFIAAASATAHGEDSIFTTLLKRQEPGTPAYNCHDNCGTAITISKASSDVCSDEVFLFDYKNCLLCAGPDNYNIWRYYGGSLSSAAEGCGLDTEPLSGKQDDVPEAMHVGDAAEESSSASSTPSETAATLTPTATAAPATTAVETPTTTESVAITTTEAVATTEVVPTGTGTVSGAPSASSNGTASYTSSAPPEFTGGAGTIQLSSAASVFGFAVLGAAFGLGS